MYLDYLKIKRKKYIYNVPICNLKHIVGIGYTLKYKKGPEKYLKQQTDTFFLL